MATGRKPAVHRLFVGRNMGKRDRDPSDSSVLCQGSKLTHLTSKRMARLKVQPRLLHPFAQDNHRGVIDRELAREAGIVPGLRCIGVMTSGDFFAPDSMMGSDRRPRVVRAGSYRVRCGFLFLFLQEWLAALVVL